MKELNEIIDGCVAWNRSDQELLYRRFAKEMYKVCRTYSKDDEDAEDMLHDAFMHVFKNIQSYNFNGAFEGWIRRVVVNCCLQILRKRKNISTVEDFPLLTDEQEEWDLEEELPFNVILSEIEKLPSKAGLVLKLYALEGWSHAEIADELSISVGTSKSQLNYARTVLKQKLALI